MTQTALHRMIRAPAGALDRIAGLDLAAPAAILAEARRVILVGTGTSQHAAELGVMMRERAGVDSRWFPAATWVRWSTGPRRGDALVVITHTGQTGYAARAWAAALAVLARLAHLVGGRAEDPGRGPDARRGVRCGTFPERQRGALHRGGGVLQLLAERCARLRGQDPDTVITGAWADPDLWQIGMSAVPR